MMFGLPDNTVELIRHCLACQPEIVRVVVYGSRAMGNYKNGSDIDLAFWTSGDQNVAAKIKDSLENLPTPYMFDVTDYSRISNAALREHIDKIGQEIYKRPSNT